MYLKLVKIQMCRHSGPFPVCQPHDPEAKGVSGGNRHMQNPILFSECIPAIDFWSAGAMTHLGMMKISGSIPAISS